MYVCMCVCYVCIQQYIHPLTPSNQSPPRPHIQASSRSHSLLLVSVKTTDRATGATTHGRLILVRACLLCVFVYTNTCSQFFGEKKINHHHHHHHPTQPP